MNPTSAINPINSTSPINRLNQRDQKGEGIRGAESGAESEEARRLGGRVVSVRLRGEGV